MPITAETWRRIDAAYADRNRGRTVDNIDPEADAASQHFRNRVHIALRQYDPPWAAGADEARREAEKRYRAELERAMRGADKVVLALQAWELGQTSSIASLTREEQALSVLWPKAVERAIAAGRRGLDDVASAWFEVRLNRPAPPPPPPFDPRTAPARVPQAEAGAGAQGSLF